MNDMVEQFGIPNSGMSELANRSQQLVAIIFVKLTYSIHRVSKNKQNFFVITSSNFHQIRQFLAERWQIV